MPERATGPAFEILEHTADIGLRASGRTREQLFENAAWGLAEITGRAAHDGAARQQPGPIEVALESSDVAALLVAWLDEILFAMERDDACMSSVRVDLVRDGSMRAHVELASCGDPPDGTELKAVTYHQLAVRDTPEGWEATVFFDV